MGELVKGGEKTKKPCKKRTNDESGEEIPDEKESNTASSNVAVFPSDSGMEKIA